jgi:hypothetical protein
MPLKAIQQQQYAEPIIHPQKKNLTNPSKVEIRRQFLLSTLLMAYAAG